MSDESIEAQSLRLLKAFVEIDVVEAREMVIYIAKCAASRAKDNHLKVADKPSR